MLRRLCLVLSAVALFGASACVHDQIRPAVGHTPVYVENREPGEHSVDVEFDAGDCASTTAGVLPGRSGSARVSGSKLRAVDHARAGTHFVLGGGVFAGNGISLYRGMIGGDVQAGINYGLGPWFDFRLVAHVEVSGDDGLWYEMATAAGFRVNLSSVFSMELDARASVMPERGYRTSDDAETHSARAALGAELALLSIRFGVDRSYELTLWHALQAAIGGNTGSAPFRTGLSFVHVFK